MVKTTGDGLHAVFATASDATAAAVDAQHAAAGGGVAGRRSRFGFGSVCTLVTAEMRDGDYYGPAVNRAARFAGGGTRGTDR